MDGSLPGSAVHGIFQARILEWAAFSFSRGSSQPRDRTWVSWIRYIGSTPPLLCSSLLLLFLAFLDSCNGLPRWLSGKELPAMQETQKTLVWSLDQEDPLKQEWKPTSVFWPGKCHGQRSLVGYSPKGRKELDTPEQLSTALHITHITNENLLYSTRNSTVVT